MDLITWAQNLVTSLGDLGVNAGKAVLVLGYVIAIARSSSKITAIIAGGVVVAVGWWFLNNATSASVQDKIKKSTAIHQVVPSTPATGAVDLTAGVIRL